MENGTGRRGEERLLVVCGMFFLLLGMGLKVR